MNLNNRQRFRICRASSGLMNLSRRGETTFLEDINAVPGNKVTANLKDNTISMTGFNGLNRQPLHFREIAPMVFREVNGKAKIAFVNDASGRHIAYVNYDTNYPSVVFHASE